MNNKGQTGLGTIFMTFIVLIVGIALIVPIFNTQNQLTDKQDVSNQSVSVVTAYVGANEVNESINHTIYSQSDWKVQSCPLTSVVVRNGAGTTLVADTDYTLYSSNGVFSLLNTTDTVPATSLNQTYVDYTYCADGYNNSSSSRGIAGLIGLFAALALLGAVFVGAKGLLDYK